MPNNWRFQCFKIGNLWLKVSFMIFTYTQQVLLKFLHPQRRPFLIPNLNFGHFNFYEVKKNSFAHGGISK